MGAKGDEGAWGIVAGKGVQAHARWVEEWGRVAGTGVTVLPGRGWVVARQGRGRPGIGEEEEAGGTDDGGA